LAIPTRERRHEEEAQKSPPAEADGLLIQTDSNLPVTATAATVEASASTAMEAAAAESATYVASTSVTASNMASGVSAT
jgi:hypothetical protein